MSKHNYFVIFLKKINLSVNSLLQKYLNKLNFSNLSNIGRSNKVFLTFAILIVLFLSYLSIPYTYDKVKISQELESQLLDKFKLNFIFSKDINYNFFPRPHFIIHDSAIIENHVRISDIKKISVYVSLNNLLSLKGLVVSNIILENSNFNLNKKNSNFFIKLLNNNFLKNSLNIKNSNIFFRDNEQEVLFISKIINMKYYYDAKELKNIIKSENEIFNIPYSFRLYRDKIKKKLISKINLNFLRIEIKNSIDYNADKKRGLASIIYNKNKSEISYNWDKNYFNFIHSDQSNNPKFFYKGNINFSPFYSIIDGNTDKINLSNSLFSQLLKTEILNNKNLNIDLNINTKEIIQLKNFIDIILNLKIQEGLIDIDHTKFNWRDYAEFKILDSLFYVSENQLILDGKLFVKVKDYEKIYRSLQVPKNLRPEVKKLEFLFKYNFDQQTIDFQAIKINNQINKKVNNFLKKIILKKDKYQNKIYLKNIMKKVIAAYVG